METNNNHFAKSRFYMVIECISFSIRFIGSISKGYLVAKVVFMLLLSIFPIITAWIFKELINRMVGVVLGETIPLQTIIYLIFAYVLLQITKIVAEWVRYYLILRSQDRINQHIDDLMMRKILKMDISIFESPEFNDKVIYLQKNKSVIEKLSYQGFMILQNIITIITAFVILWRFSFTIALLIVVFSIPAFISNNRFQALFYWQSIKDSNNFRKRNYLHDLIFGRRFAYDMRFYPKFQKNIVKLHNDMWKRWLEERKDILFNSNIRNIFFTGLLNLCIAGTFILSIARHLAGQIMIGDIQFYVNLAAQVSADLKGVFNELIDMNLNANVINDFNNFIIWEPITKCTGEQLISRIDTLEFKNVWFKYPDSSKYVLQDINFKISGMDKTSIVGLNGCGKTTIVKLILRFYEPTQGEIIVNGLNIRNYEINSYRKNFGVLFQDYPVYYTTIRKNIVLSDLSSETDDARIKKSIQLSGLNKLQDQFPKGLATEISKVFDQDGVELSGGNRQKLALARAYFRTADIMILDEPSSTLDAQAEHDLFTHFNTLHQGKGAILISHRLSNVCDSNEIMFIDEGRVRERGSHKELLELKGRYAELFSLQASKYQLDCNDDKLGEIESHDF